MHPAFYMLEKEWLEHKSVTRIPLFVLICILALFAGLLGNGGLSANVSFQMTSSGFEDFDLQFVDEFSSLLVAGAGLLSVMLSTLYFPRTLRKERQEGSFMFWRSMPVSNLRIHLVKLGFGLLVIPLICSLLVVTVDSLLWVVNVMTEDAIPLFYNQRDVLFIPIHWLLFLLRMVLVALALLPLACFTLLLSQLVSAPIMVMFIGVYALQWVTLGVTGSDWFERFFDQIFALPLHLLTDSDMAELMTQISALNLLIYFAIGALSFVASLRLYQTDETSWRALLKR